MACPHLHAILSGLLLVGAAGCASKPAKPKPAAEQDAERLARQALQLQIASRWAAAADGWGRAAQQYQLLNQLTNLAMAWHNQGLCAEALGQLDDARALLESAADLNESLKLSDAWWRNQITLLQWENAHGLTNAATRFAALQSRAAGLGDARLEGLWWHEAARVHLGDGQLDVAVADLQKAQSAFESVNDVDGIAAVTVSRARILVRRGALNEAEAAWREALERYQQLASPRGIAVSLAGLGSCLATQPGDHRAEAETFLRRASENLRALGMAEDSAAVGEELDQLRSRQ